MHFPRLAFQPFLIISWHDLVGEKKKKKSSKNYLSMLPFSIKVMDADKLQNCIKSKKK